MSKILDFANKYNIQLTEIEKDKIISLEIMLKLSNCITDEMIKINPLSIHSNQKRYYIYKRSNKKIVIHIFEERKDKTEILKNNLISAVEYCVQDIEKSKQQLLLKENS